MRDFRLGRFATVLIAGALTVLGCDEDPLDPDVTGIVDAVVQDNPQQVASAAFSDPEATNAFSGTAAGDMHVSLRTTDGEWVDVGSPNGITVNLQSSGATTVHGPTSVPVADYDRVRLTMSEVEVTVEAGSVIEETTLQGDAKATIAADAPLVVERTVAEFSISESGTAMVVFELNAENWLNLSVLDAGAIDDDAVRSNVTASAAGT